MFSQKGGEPFCFPPFFLKHFAFWIFPYNFYVQSKGEEPFRWFPPFLGIRVPEPMRFEKAISTAICAILTRHAPAWLVRFACKRRSYLFSNFCEPNHEAFIGYGEAEDDRRLAPSEDDNEARAGKAHDLAHCSRHPDARPPSDDLREPRVPLRILRGVL